MITPRASGRPSVLSAALAALLIALGAALGVSAPALAHDSLVSSDPADGDTLETSPEQITLDYSGEVLEVSPVVRVVDDAGEVVIDEVPQVSGRQVSAPLPGGLAPGAYTVQWRVVSSDGHPIEGTIDFEVTGGDGTLGAGAGAGSGASGETSDAGGTVVEPTAAPGSPTSSEPAAADPEQSTGLSPLLIAGFAALLAAVIVGVAVALRKR